MVRSRVIIPILLLLFAFSACKTQRQIQTEYVYIHQTDTVSQIKYRVDSINIHDSIVTLIKGDTVITDRWHTQYRDRLRVDTVEKIRTETIYQTRTDIQTREVNRLYWWQKTLMWIGGIGILGIIGLIIFIIYKLKKHFLL